MTRVKGGTVARARRKKVLNRAKGYFGSKHRLFKSAHEQLMHSGRYSFNDRKKNKGNFRKLWITRINAACRMNNISYSKFIDGLNKAGVEINRKMLSEIAIADMNEFAKLVEVAKKGLENPIVKETKVEVKSESKNGNDLSSKTVAELKALAKEKGIEGYTNMKKAELLAALN